MALYDNKTLFNYVIDLGIIDKKKLENLNAAAEKKHVPLGELLLESDLIGDEILGKIIAELISMSYVRLTEVPIQDEVLETIPEVVARKQKIIAFKKDQKGLHVAMSDPHNLVIRDFLKKKIGMPIVVYYATERDILDSLRFYAKDVVATFDEIIKENVQKLKNIKGEKVEPPIIKIVDTILTYAYQNKASDIHIEPQETLSLVRFRIDGVLHDIVSLPVDLHKPIVTRIKVIANLRTDEHQSAQDGKFQFKAYFSGTLDVRVSIVPTTKGEKIVMRLLSERSRQYSLAELGLSESDHIKVRRAYVKPFGMILATGPTGSGKTTTMYAILKLLNTREVNIATIEDPVEYDIEGINQIQVNPKTNLTFAAGLKSILRQDPNIILVGEIRDEETAAIAINSAMTGHLVLSTLHTNDAPTAIPRLLDMKIEPYLVASTVNVIIAQRLVRKIHISCRASSEIEVSMLNKQFGDEMVKKVMGKVKEKTIRVYYGKGCQVCQNTAFEGRVGIYEVIEVNDQIRQSIIDRKDASTIKKIAIETGMKTMIENGLQKIKEGITTVEEVMRVTKE